MSLRVVFDTSTLVSAALRPGSVPEQALLRAIQRHQVLTGIEAILELARVLEQNKFDRYVSKDSRFEFLRRLHRDGAQCSVPQDLLTKVRGACRDPEDDKFLDLCLAAKANVLFSSDLDLLVLNPWNGFPVLTPAQFLAQSEI